jgi:outer membrane protein TolC
MRKIQYLILFLLVGYGSLSAQTTSPMRFSLDQAVAYALKHNYGIINSGKDLQVAKQKVNEQIAAGLPQINGSINYHDNVSRPVMILPGDLAGQPGKDLAIQFGKRYDANFMGQVSQLIFDGRYLIGLKAAKIAFDQADKAFFKDKLSVKQQVANAYYQAVSLNESLRIIDSTLRLTKKISMETQHIYQEGLTDDIQVDQLKLLVANLEASHTFLKNQSAIGMAFLKFYLGLDKKDHLVLTDNLSALIHKKQLALASKTGFNLSQSIDYQLMQTNKQLMAMQLKLAKAAYLPSISASLNYETQAQRDVWNFFESDKWYQSAVIGVTMRIPIFSSGQRLSQYKQAKLAYEKAKVLQKQTASQLEIQVQTAENDYKNALSVYTNKMTNRKIAEKIYRKTTEKFSKGMASSLDLLNTHNQFLSAENEFINAELNVLKSAENLQMLLSKHN